MSSDTLSHLKLFE